MVVLLAVEGVRDLVGSGTCFADLLEPEFFVELVESWGWTGDLLGVDEDATGAERGEDLGEERFLGSVVEVVDGERGDDGVLILGERGVGVVGDLEADVGVGCEASTRAIEHGRGDVHEMDVGAGIPGADEGGE